MSWLRRLATLPIRFYQRVLSPFTPAICRFSPTCSQYTVEAIEERGFWVGSGLSIWRLARCNPFCKGGWDPVPCRGEGHARE